MKRATGALLATFIAGCTPGDDTSGTTASTPPFMSGTDTPGTTVDDPGATDPTTGPDDPGTSTAADPSTSTTTDPTTTAGPTSDTTADPTSSSTSDTTGAPAQWPADVLDLTDWKLTLPIAGDAPDEPLEVLQPELATYTIDPWYVLADGGAAVRFRADAGGVTTSNSGYPRSELREMTGGGSEPAAWTTTAGVHTMTITQAITHLPDVKPHVVAGQIHDDADDVVMIRLEGTYLFVEGGGDDLGVLDPDYQLGTPFTVRLRAADGAIDIFYEDLRTPAVSVERDAQGCYFKAGVYTQSNPDKGDEPDAYGEVEISDLVVTHE